MADSVTVPFAARFLEVPESHVKRKIKDGTLGVDSRGSWGRPLISYDDVKHYARSQRLGRLGRLELTVMVVGELDDAELALRTSGLEVQRVDSIMLALLRHEAAGAPIIIASPGAISDGLSHLREYGLLDELQGMMHLAIITVTQTSVPWAIERQAEIIDPWEPRRLVQWAWRALEARAHAGSLGL